MDDRNTMDRLLAGEALTPTEAAVFGAGFARRFERRRYACEPDDEPGEMDLRLACDAVDAMNTALAEARASAPVAPVAEPVAVTFEPGPIRPEPPDHEVDRLRGVLSSLIDWTHQHGRNLCPGTIDTYGEGVRACKSQVANMISAAFLAEPAPAESTGDALPLWECGADGVWSRGPLNATAAWVCETTFAYHSGRALAPMGPARQTLEEAMRDADEAAVRAGHRLPADSICFRPELADEVRGTVWEWRPGESACLVDVKASWSLDATREVIRALKQVMPREQAADALARILRVHGADVREVGP